MSSPPSTRLAEEDQALVVAHVHDDASLILADAQIPAYLVWPDVHDNNVLRLRAPNVRGAITHHYTYGRKFVENFTCNLL